MTNEFGQAVRRWRDRVAPEVAGLPAGGPRRAAGLRREELALLAGISVDYVTRLEQGRATSPSAQVVESLARSLRLGAEEREHLYRLAGLVPPGPGTVPAVVTPSVQRLMDRLSETPLAVHDAMWNLITCNRLWAALIPDYAGNSLRRHFLDGDNPVQHTPEQKEAFETSAVADLRAAAATYPKDQQLRRLVADLRSGSARFARLWETGTVGTHASARKTIRNAQVGLITLDCDVLRVTNSDLRIIVYSAEPGSPDADRLALLSVVGTQTMA